MIISLVTPAVWILAIGISFLHLSPLEKPYSPIFWLLLLGAGIAYIIGVLIGNWGLKIYWKLEIRNWKLGQSQTSWILFILFILTILGNLLVWLKVGNFPLMSPNPERFRFILNKEVWGLWEWFALLPRWGIPIAVWYLGQSLALTRWKKIMAWAFIFSGTGILFLYASRSLLLFPLILSYVIVMMHERDRGWRWRRVGLISLLFGIMAAAIFFLIPALRYLISFAVLYEGENLLSLEFLIQLTQIQVPHALRLLVLPYLALSFNLQTLNHLVGYYGEVVPHAGGGMLATVFDPIIPGTIGYTVATVPWREIFQFWWVTATGLAQPFIDFGIAGVLTVAFLWGYIVRLIEQWARYVGSANLIANLLLGFVVVAGLLSIYTNIFYRRETYLDLTLLIILWLVSRYISSHGTARNLFHIV